MTQNGFSNCLPAALSAIDGLIFDVDGTIWNSTPIVAEAWSQIFKETPGLSRTVTDKDLQRIFGRTMRDIAMILFPEIDPDTMDPVWERCYKREHELIRQTLPHIYEGFDTVMQTLSKRFPLFIVSNCQAGYIELLLELTGWGPYVTDHLCPADTGLAKADNIRTLCRRYGLRAPAYVGDTAGDEQATREAGAAFIFAEYGFGQAAHPDLVIARPADLLTLGCGTCHRLSADGSGNSRYAPGGSVSGST